MPNFLLLQTAFIGDVVLATALVEKLHRSFPEAEIDFLLRKGNEGLLARHPHIRRVWVWDKGRGKYRHLWRLLRQIRAERYDGVINLQRFFSTGLLTAFSRGKARVGFDKNPWSFAFDRKVPHRWGTDETPLHEVERNLQLIAEWADDAFEPPRLYPPEDALDELEISRPYVCLAPTSVWFTKQWPAGKWVELLRRLPADHCVYLLGGPADHAVCERILQESGREKGVNLAGRIGLLASAALMAGAEMNYVNDSAPLHLASAMNAPVTAIFCSTVPRFGFGPLSDRSFIAETAENLPCRPCGLHGYRACPEGHFRCADIDPGAVLALNSGL